MPFRLAHLAQNKNYVSSNESPTKGFSMFKRYRRVQRVQRMESRSIKEHPVPLGYKRVPLEVYCLENKETQTQPYMCRETHTKA